MLWIKMVPLNFQKTINVRRPNVSDKMILSPNPAKNNISVQTTSAIESIGTISILNMAGKTMEIRTVNLINGLNTINVDLENLPAGLYLLSIKTHDGMQVQKFVKQ